MAPQSRPLRVVLAGYGLAGAVFHAPLMRSVDGLELMAVVTRDPARREALAAAFPDARPVDTLADGLSLGADLVVIASPNRFHAPLALEALDAGCHVVVDKPLAIDAEAEREVAARAQAADRLLMPFHNRRWDDDFLTLRRIVGEGRLGRVLRYESRFDRWRPQPKEGAWRELGDPADGGGLLLDLGTHLADQALMLLGPVTSVYAELARRRPGVAVEDDVFLALEHVGGARSHLWAGVHAAQPPPRLRVLGERAAFVSYGLDPQEDELRAGATPLDPGFGRRPAERAATVWDDGEHGEPVAMEAGRWRAFYEGVVAAVRDGAPPPVAAAEAVRVAEVLDAARLSAQTATVVAVG